MDALENGGRILVTRLQYLGDVVLTLPLVDAIRDRFPRARVDYLCRPPASELLRGDARFETVFEQRSGDGFAASLSLIRRLRARRYDAVVDLYSNPRSAWLARLTGAAVRIGGDRRGRRRLYTHPVSVPPDVRSAMDHHMKFVEPIGVKSAPRKPEITPAPGDIETARDLLESHGVETRRPDRPRIGIHPGGKWSVKRWPVPAFAELVAKLAEEWNASVVAFTGPGDQAHSRRLREAVGDSGAAAAFLPILPVRTVAAALSLLDGVVVSDGGVMHVSVAVGTPTVGIFGSAEPDIWFPYELFGPYIPAVIPMECRPCHRHECPLGHTNCLNELPPDFVLTKLRGVMTNPAQSGDFGSPRGTGGDE
jgi:heptosyltransferase-2